MQKHNSNLYIRTSVILSIALIVIGFYFIYPQAIAQAHVGIPDHLVPCGLKGQPMCNVCDLYQLSHNVIDLALWGLAAPILAIAILIGGFYWLTSAGNEEKIKKGKGILWSALLGFFLAFGSWVIINTIMSTFEFKSPFNQSAVWTDTSFCANSPFVDTGTGPVTPAPSPVPTGPPPPPIIGGSITHSQALQQLTNAGITVTSTGNCSDRTNTSCTSLDGVSQGTINKLVMFKNDCACQVVVTGGTEGGHAAGTCSHSSGCKVDIDDLGAANSYIQTRYQRVGTRCVDSAPVYRAPNGTEFARESDHWDIAAVSGGNRLCG